FDVNGEKINIYPDSKVVLRHLDYSLHDSESGKNALASFIDKQLNTPFNLMLDPLLMISLCQIGNEGHVLVFTIHHIIGDGWSPRVLFKELSDLYAFHIGRGEPFALPSVQMSDFLKEEVQFINSEDYHKNEQYWFTLFEGHVP